MASELAGSRAVAAALWPPPPQARRGPKPRFSVEGITEAAIVIADREGLEAVTMRAVAEAVGTTKMALYRHVPGRTELDALMLDKAMGDPPMPRYKTWRSGLRSWAELLYGRAAEHPWTVELAQRPHLPGPRELGWYEAGLAAITDLPLSGAERLDTLALLAGQVLSLVRQAAVPNPERTLADGLADVFAERAGEYPHAFAAFADSSARDNALAFGLERILDGVDALVVSRRADSAD